MFSNQHRGSFMVWAAAALCIATVVVTASTRGQSERPGSEGAEASSLHGRHMLRAGSSAKTRAHAQGSNALAESWAEATTNFPSTSPPSQYLAWLDRFLGAAPRTPPSGTPHTVGSPTDRLSLVIEDWPLGADAGPLSISVTEAPASPVIELPGAAPITLATIDGICSNAWVQDAVAATNVARAVRGVGPLSCDSGLAAQAKAWSERQCDAGGLSHNGMSTRCAAAGYARACAENVLFNYESGAGAGGVAAQQWVDSPGHYANMITPNWHVVGYGWHVCGDGKVYWSGLYA